MNLINYQKSLFGETYITPLYAYSTRKLNPYYNGPCVRVRRASDSQERDVYFDSNGDINRATLSNFAIYMINFYETLYVTRFYIDHQRKHRSL